VRGGDIGDVGQQHVDLAAQRRGQGGEQVALEDVTAQVVQGTGHGDRVTVGGEEADGGGFLPYGETERAGATAEVDDGPAPRAELCERGVDEELAADPGHEDAGAQAHPDTTEVGVTDDLFQGLALHSAIDQLLKVRRVGGGGAQHGGFVLGEDAAGAAELDDRWSQVGDCHEASF
jgi:hypothetical protein